MHVALNISCEVHDFVYLIFISYIVRAFTCSRLMCPSNDIMIYKTNSIYIFRNHIYSVF